MNHYLLHDFIVFFLLKAIFPKLIHYIEQTENECVWEALDMLCFFYSELYRKSFCLTFPTDNYSSITKID